MQSIKFFVIAIQILWTVSDEEDDFDKSDLVQYNETQIEEFKKNIAMLDAMFHSKRIEQTDAVKTISRFKYEQKYKIMLTMLNHTLMAAFQSKTLFENSNYIPGLPMPPNSTLAEALYELLMSVSLYGELQLKLPEITDRIMRRHPDWQFVIKWSIGFLNSTDVLDKKSIELIHLVAQDMRLVERSPTFVNPYRPDENALKNVPNSDYETMSQKKKKAITKSPKSPRISKPRNTEL